ncbi:MAG TPA: DUF5677 domain-containing protein [bacterium]|nr:DUF5677 domain-containing protein [bacterium]
MNNIDKKITLFNDILLFVQSYKFKRDKINFIEKKEAVYIYSYKERIVSLSQSCSLLLDNKNYIDTQILSRSALEALFYMLALMNNQSFLKNIIKDHTKQKIKVFNDLKNNKDIALQFKITNEKLNEYLLDLSNQIEYFNDVSDMVAKEAATMADLLNMYMSSYRLLSLATHSKALIIQENFSYTNGVFKFNKHQRKKLAEISLDTLIQVLLLMSFSLVSYSGITSQKVKNTLLNFDTQYKIINKK